MQLDSTSRICKDIIAQEDPKISHSSFAQVSGTQAVLSLNHIFVGFSLDSNLLSYPEGLHKWDHK